MFDGIRHVSTLDGITYVRYRAGDVRGSISFQVTPDLVGVLSSVGPESAVRECAVILYLGSFGWRSRTSEDVVDLS